MARIVGPIERVIGEDFVWRGEGGPVPRKTEKGAPYKKSVDWYEKKLPRVMERLGAEDYRFDWGRWEAWVEVRYKGRWRRFSHSVQKARETGTELKDGRQCFARLVLTLEDLARMVTHGIYDLEVWISGIPLLPPASELPQEFALLGFERIPDTEEEIRERYRTLTKRYHPDHGGSDAAFQVLTGARDRAIQHLRGLKADDHVSESEGLRR